MPTSLPDRYATKPLTRETWPDFAALVEANAAALDAISQAGGGTVEAYPEQLDGRGPQRGTYLHTGPEDLFVEFGFVRDRRIAKWRWVMRATVSNQRGRGPVAGTGRGQARLISFDIGGGSDGRRSRS